NAHASPHDHFARRLIADQGFMQPIARVTELRTGTISSRGPSSPEKESGHGPHTFFGPDGACRDRVIRISINEDAGVVLETFGEGASAGGIDRYDTRGRIVGVGTVHLLQTAP